MRRFPHELDETRPMLPRQKGALPDPDLLASRSVDPADEVWSIGRFVALIVADGSGDDRRPTIGEAGFLTGPGATRWLVGGPPRDLQIGGPENDLLVGHEGPDTLLGTAGADVLLEIGRASCRERV